MLIFVMMTTVTMMIILVKDICRRWSNFEFSRHVENQLIGTVVFYYSHYALSLSKTVLSKLVSLLYI